MCGVGSHDHEIEKLFLKFFELPEEVVCALIGWVDVDKWTGLDPDANEVKWDMYACKYNIYIIIYIYMYIHNP